MRDSDVEELDIQLPHRICKPFKYTMLDVVYVEINIPHNYIIYHYIDYII